MLRKPLINYHPPARLVSVSTNQTLAQAGAVLTGTALSIGAPYPTRRVFVVASATNHSGRTQVSQTIGGVNASLHAEASDALSQSWIAIISAVVPFGTTADVVLTASTTIFNAGICAIYTVDDRSLRTSIAVTGSDAPVAGTSLAPSVANKGNGFLIGCTTWTSGAGKSAVAPTNTGIVTDLLNDAVVNFSVPVIGSSISEVYTTSWTGVFSGVGALVSFR